METITPTRRTETKELKVEVYDRKFLATENLDEVKFCFDWSANHDGDEIRIQKFKESRKIKNISQGRREI
jgi:hypothetical protein